MAWTRMEGDQNETPADKAARLFADRKPLGHSRSCPHCHSTARKVCCTICTRDMCEDCISDDPDIGPICGLCYDHKHNPADPDTTPF